MIYFIVLINFILDSYMPDLYNYCSTVEKVFVQLCPNIMWALLLGSSYVTPVLAATCWF